LDRAKRLAFNYFPRGFDDRQFFRRVSQAGEDAARYRESLQTVIASGEILYRDECMSGQRRRRYTKISHSHSDSAGMIAP